MIICTYVNDYQDVHTPICKHVYVYIAYLLVATGNSLYACVYTYIHTYVHVRSAGY